MTSDEFERMLLAITNMRGVVVNGEVWVSAETVIRIIHSNLHAEDKEAWKYDPVTRVWHKEPRT